MTRTLYIGTLYLLLSFAGQERRASDSRYEAQHSDDRNDGSGSDDRNLVPGKPPLVASKDTTVTRFFRRTKGCIAADGGFSVPLRNGRVLWLMGDSHLDDLDSATGTVPCLFQARNAALLQPHADWNAANTMTLRRRPKAGAAVEPTFLPHPGGDSLFCWPGAGFQWKDSVYVVCTGLRNKGTGAFGFEATGRDFLTVMHVDKLDGPAPVTAWLDESAGIAFGAGFVERDRHVYVYGQKYTGSQMKAELYVARFAKKKGPRAAWSYWNGSGFSNDAASATPIASQTGVSGTLQVSEVEGRILLLSSELSIDCDAGTRIYASVAGTPTGPFREKKQIHAIDDRKDGHRPFFYVAIAHPEYINDRQELLITYAVNGYGSCVPDCRDNRMDPDLYRLRGIRVAMDQF